MLTGVFATKLINGDLPSLTLGLDGGLLYGHPGLLWKQLIAVGATYAYCGIGTLVLLVVINAITRLRASEDEEIIGLDLSQHSERAYASGGGEAIGYMRHPEPKAASAPPITGGRFTIALEGIDCRSLQEYWRDLCKVDRVPPTAAFKEIYRHMTTVRQNRFRFRGGNREQIRLTLETLFRNAFPSVRARLANEEHAPALV